MLHLDSNGWRCGSHSAAVFQQSFLVKAETARELTGSYNLPAKVRKMFSTAHRAVAKGIRLAAQAVERAAGCRVVGGEERIFSGRRLYDSYRFGYGRGCGESGCGVGCCRNGSSIRRQDFYRHEERMTRSPGHGLAFCFEKAVDDNGVAFVRGASRFSGSLPVDNRGASINRGQGAAVAQHNFASVWNVTRIDRAMSLL